MNCLTRICLSAGVLLAAQDGVANTALMADTAFSLDEVMVTARTASALTAQSILTSVDIAGAKRLQDANTDYPWELFGQMPGVMLTEFNQGTTSGRFSLRAFNGEGQINAVKLLIDGVPANSNNGAMPYLDAVFPLQIARLEVVRGTNDPRYGQHNIAGNANVVTRTGGNDTQARVSVGSWNTVDGQWVHDHEQGQWSQNYLAAYHHTLGYRDHADSARYALSGKWFYHLDGQTHVGLSVRGYKNTADEPGYLTRAQAAEDPEQSPAHASSDGSERELYQVAVFADLPLSEQLSWANVVYRNQWDEDRFVRFSASAAQQERIAHEQHHGLRSIMTLRPQTTTLSDLQVTWGLDAEWQENLIRRYRTSERQRGAPTQNQTATFNVYGAFVQIVIKPTLWLKLVPAYRVDRLSGHFNDVFNNVQASMYDFGFIRQPKLSSVVSLGRSYSLYGNWGRSYQVGVGRASYKVPPLQNNLQPSINTGWETGLKFAPLNWLNGRVSYWQQTATNEWQRLLGDPNGDSVNVGETLRKGYDVQVNMQPARRVNLWLAYANQYARILTPGSTELNAQGKEIDHVPHHVYSAGVDFQVMPALRLSLDVNGQSDYYLERFNLTDKFGDYTQLSFTAAYQVNEHLSLAGQLKNLTATDAEYVWWDTDQTPNASMHSPGDPRALHLAAKYQF